VSLCKQTNKQTH